MYHLVFLDSIDPNDVVMQTKNELDNGQLWTKVRENAEGYFFLKNIKNLDSSELLTAVSKSDLKVTGNFKTTILHVSRMLRNFLNFGLFSTKLSGIEK